MSSTHLRRTPTPALMEKFYEEFAASGDSTKALFEAKLAVRRSGWLNPDSWAPFILIGDPH